MVRHLCLSMPPGSLSTLPSLPCRAALWVFPVPAGVLPWRSGGGDAGAGGGPLPPLPGEAQLA